MYGVWVTVRVVGYDVGIYIIYEGSDIYIYTSIIWNEIILNLYR